MLSEVRTALGEVIFRPMEDRDTKAAALIEAQSSREPWSQAAYQEALSNENACYLVAQINGAVVGCCGLWQSFEDADICNVVVKKECRRQGVAERMLFALMQCGKERGVENFTLEVRKSNLAAVQLYEKLGFVTEGVRRNFYDNPGEDALIMWKRQETQHMEELQ